MKIYDVELTFKEDFLGSVPFNKEIYSSYIESKKPQDIEDGEVETVPEINGETGFHEDDNGKFIYDYNIKGFFKDTCSALKRVPGTKSKELTAFKKIIDGLVFIFPRRIYIDTAGYEYGTIERPLRASTAKGERVALAKSVTAPMGSKLKFEIHVIGAVSDILLKEWLDYGELKGLGQWRNAGYGRFSYEYKKRS